MGKRRDAKMAALVGDAVKAGLTGSPMQSSGATMIPGNEIALPNQNMPSLAMSLARDSDQFGSMMGPNYPLYPFPIDPLGPNGRPDPRKYQYDIFWNLQINRELAKWNILKSAAEQCDVVARALTIKAMEVSKMDKSWVISDEAIAAVLVREGDIGTAQASVIARKENAALIAKLNDFWDNPYPQSDRGWREWITEAMWQVGVFDGLAVHPQMNLGAKVIGLNIIDASTIKCLLNNYGDIPRPPDPAYQQITYGFPRGEWLATADSDAPAFVDGAFGTTMRDQLSYYVMNRRTWTPYGFSPVEQSLPLVNLYLEYQKMMLFEFKHGTSSDVYMKTSGQELDLKSIASWERIYNDYTEGSTANRKKTRLLPEGFDPVFGKTVDEGFTADYVESIIKRIAGIFGVSSMQLGVLPRAGLGGGKGAQEGDEDNAESVSSKPMMNFIVEIVNSLSRRYLGATKMVTFSLQDDKGGQDDVEIANATKIDTNSGTITLNEARRARGLPDYAIPEADVPFIGTPTGPIYFTGTLDTQLNPPKPPTPIIQHIGVPNESQDGSQVSSSQEKEGTESETRQGAGGAAKAGLKTDDTAKSVDSQWLPRRAPIAKVLLTKGYMPDGDDEPVEVRYPDGSWHLAYVQMIGPNGDIAVAAEVGGDAEWLFDESDIRRVKTDEAKSFKRFMQKSHTREFVFKYHTPEEADLLKAGLVVDPKGSLLTKKAEDHPDHAKLTALASKHARALHVALLGGVTGVSTAIDHALKDTSAVTAVAQNVVFDNANAKTVLGQIYTDAGNLAAQSAADALGTDAVASRSVEDLLSARGITLKGINDSSMKRISDAIAQGISNGDGHRTISDAVQAIISDPKRADVISITESNRSYNGAFVDQLKAAGETQFDWVNDADPCPDCEDELGPHDIGDDGPPLHPNCRCVAAMVTAS